MGGGGANFVQNQQSSFQSIDFRRRGRAELNFVQPNEMLEMCIPFSLSTEG